METKSLILHRSMLLEHLLDDEERGVKVSLEGDSFDEEDFNMLHEIKITDQKIGIMSSFRNYQLDVSEIENRQRLPFKETSQHSSMEPRGMVEYGSLPRRLSRGEKRPHLSFPKAGVQPPALRVEHQPMVKDGGLGNCFKGNRPKFNWPTSKRRPGCCVE
jgi:hypothetical protein